MGWNLVGKTLRDYRWAMAWYGLGVVAYGLFIMWFYPTVRDNPRFDELLATYPRELLEAFGISGSLTGFPAYIAGEYFSLMWPIFVVPLVIAAGSAAVALEIDRGTIQALLAMPLSRTRLVLGKWLALAATLLVIVAMSIAALLLGARWFGIEVPAGRLAEVGALGLALFLAVGSYSLLFSAFSDERGRAVGLAIGLTLYSYFANTLAHLSDRLDFLRYTSLFALWEPQAILEGRDVPWEEAAALLAICLACLAVATIWFRRRDIAP